jgi:hypothetical protein
MLEHTWLPHLKGRRSARRRSETERALQAALVAVREGPSLAAYP